MTALYFHYYLHNREVYELDTIEDAADIARHDSDLGRAAFECIEILTAPVNVVYDVIPDAPPDEDDEPMLPVVAWLDIRSPTKSEWHRLRGFETRADADETASDWATRLGEDRVRVRKAERL